MIDKQDNRYWEILTLVFKAEKNGISKTKLDYEAKKIVSNNTLTSILEQLHIDQLIIYPPKGDGWRKGQTRIARITDTGKQVLQNQIKKKEFIDTMPEQLEEITISKEQIKKAEQERRQRFRKNNPRQFPFVTQARLALSTKEQEKQKLFIQNHDEESAQDKTNSKKIFLSYPNDEPVELSGVMKKLFLNDAINLIDHALYKKYDDESKLEQSRRNTPFRIILEYTPFKYGKSIIEIEKKLFPKWMKIEYPKEILDENELKSAIEEHHYMNQYIDNKVANIVPIDLSQKKKIKEIRKRSPKTISRTEQLQQYYSYFKSDFRKYWFH